MRDDYKNFERLENSIKKRASLIEYYGRKLKEIKGVHFQENSLKCTSNSNYMVIFLDSSVAGVTRDELHRALQAVGIETKQYFSPPLHRLILNSTLSLPKTDQASETCLALPLYEEMSVTAVDYVCDKILEILEGNK